MFLLKLTVPQHSLSPGTLIPQRTYCQGATIQGGGPGQVIMFATADGKYIPAELVLAGQCDLLVDGNGTVFTDYNQTINLRIEVPSHFVIPKAITYPISSLQWPGYDRWGAQVSIMAPRWAG